MKTGPSTVHGRPKRRSPKRRSPSAKVALQSVIESRSNWERNTSRKSRHSCKFLIVNGLCKQRRVGADSGRGARDTWPPSGSGVLTFAFRKPGRDDAGCRRGRLRSRAVRSELASAAASDGPGTGRLGPTAQTQRMQDSIIHRPSSAREKMVVVERTGREVAPLAAQHRAERYRVDVHEPVGSAVSWGTRTSQSNGAIARDYRAQRCPVCQ